MQLGRRGGRVHSIGTDRELEMALRALLSKVLVEVGSRYSPEMRACVSLKVQVGTLIL